MKRKKPGTKRRPAPVAASITSNLFQLRALPAYNKTVLVSRPRFLGYPVSALVEFNDYEMVGALEEATDMRDIVLKTGVCVLASLLNYPVNSEGRTVQGLMQRLCEWSKIDVDKIKAEIAAEREEEVRAEHEAEMAKLEAEEAAKAADPAFSEEAPTQDVVPSEG